MQSLTPTVVPAPGAKKSRSTYLAWSLAAIVVPLSVLFLLGIAAAVAGEWGVAGVVVGIALFPVTIVVMPFHAGAVHGDWRLVALAAGLILAGWQLLRTYDRGTRPSD